MSRTRALKVKGRRSIRYMQMKRWDLVRQEARGMWRVLNRRRYAARIMGED